jgi:hypothetical protein
VLVAFELDAPAKESSDVFSPLSSAFVVFSPASSA